MPGVLCGIGSRIWHGIACAIRYRPLCGALRLELRACSSLRAAPRQIAQHASRGLHRGKGLSVRAQAAVNPLGYKKQGIIVQRLPAVLAYGRNQSALQGGAFL